MPDTVIALPSHVDLRPLCPPVYDQGPFNSCTANALAADIEFVKMKQGQDDTGTPSRMDLYEQSRKRAGRFPDDGGAAIADGVACCQDAGVCPETDWPYTAKALNQAPTERVLAHRHDNRIVQALGFDNTHIDDIRKSLAEG